LAQAAASTQPAEPSPPTPGEETGAGKRKKPGPELSPPPADSLKSASAEVEALKKEAQDVATSLVKSFPDNPEALRVLGLVNKALGKMAKASECWETALRLAPSRSDIYVLLAALAELQGEHEKAADICRTGLAKAVPTPALYRSLATALNSLGKPDEAVAPLQHAAEMSPKDGENHQMLAKTYALLDQQEKAKTSYELTLKLQPGNGSALYGLAMACAKLGLEEQSKQLFDQCEKLAAENRGMEQGLSDVAKHKQILAVTCGDAAMVYAGQRQLAKAEELLRRAAVFLPKNTTFQTRLAAVLVNMDRTQEAIPIYRELIANDPRNPGHHLALAEIYALLGQFSNASVAAKKAVELEPNNEEYRRILLQLEARR
jgi:tetratricopeptide (TPR) repeat protein